MSCRPSSLRRPLHHAQRAPVPPRGHHRRGCPCVTITAAGPIDISVASVHAFVEVGSTSSHHVRLVNDSSAAKWRLRMDSGQTFLLDASSPIHLAQATPTQLSATAFSPAP